MVGWLLVWLQADRKRINPAADEALEQRRLELSIVDNVLTDYVRENGFGGIDPARMETAIAQLGKNYEFQNTPDASLYFDASYLPEGLFELK